MKALLLVLVVAGTTTQVSARQVGHAGNEPAVPPAEQPSQHHPHAEHRTPPESSQPAPDDSAHAMHAPDQPAEPAAEDPHAGHDPASPRLSDSQAEHDVAAGAAQPPPEAFAGPRHAADTLFGPSAMQAARDDLRTEHGDMRTWWLMAERAETGLRGGSDDYLWDLQAWYGGDFNKVWLKSEGEGTFRENTEEVELQALWSRAITPWFDFQAGVRYDFRPQPERGHLVVGLQGLVPYRFELDSALFLSEEGDVTARVEAEYDLRITQRLILQPRIELNAALSGDPEIGLASGVNNTELGLRLRYEVRREFAPYIGISWEQLYGRTADLARDEDESTSVTSLVLGVRAWF